MITILIRTDHGIPPIQNSAVFFLEPMLRRLIPSTLLLLLVLVLTLPVLLSGPSSQTMAVAMFDLWSNGQGPELAALGLLWSCAMTTIALIFYFFARRSGVGMYGQG